MVGFLIAGMICLSFNLLSVDLARGEEPVGWRADGKGQYPQATPTLHWTDLHNQVWSSTMPAAGNATPVLVKDRLFLCAEPSTLLAVDCYTGQILWQHANDYVDLLGDEAWTKVEDELKGKQPEIRQLNGIAQQIWMLQQQLQQSPQNADKLKAQLARLTTQRQQLKDAIGPALNYSLPPTHSALGYTSATPVSDGEHVYVVFGTGLVACYDLDGQRRWLRLVERPDNPNGHTASPVLVDGHLLVHFNNLIALDPATGAERWRAGSAARWGSTVVSRIGGESVAFTPSGDAVRVKDGQVLARELGDATFSTPIIQGQRMYFVDQEVKAVALPTGLEAGQLEAKTLWSVQLPKDRYCASPLFHEGLLYAVTQGGVLTALNAENGAVLYQEKLPVGGRVSPSITLGGQWIYVGDEAGRMQVLQPGREFKVLTENLLEPHRASPVFARQRMYLRALKTLYCIGGDWAPPAPGEVRASPVF